MTVDRCSRAEDPGQSQVMNVLESNTKIGLAVSSLVASGVSFEVHVSPDGREVRVIADNKERASRALPTVVPVALDSATGETFCEAICEAFDDVRHQIEDGK